MHLELEIPVISSAQDLVFYFTIKFLFLHVSKSCFFPGVTPVGSQTEYPPCFVMLTSFLIWSHFCGKELNENNEIIKILKH